ncbi:MAG: HEAT repeat domain-containing protein [Micrococcales bacterium]|nr:HEAT repeat domain-containing protein [Micrococcales bacterium]
MHYGDALGRRNRRRRIHRERELLKTEVGRFQSWADSYLPHQRCGEWECDYEEWSSIYQAVLGFVAACPFGSWSHDDARTVLYAIARDNEMEHLAGEIRRQHPDLLVWLTHVSIAMGEPDDRWQLAAELGRLASEEAEQLLLQLAHDQDEYVRRKALSALAKLSSPAVEELAVEAWHRPDPHQQWARMAALSALQQIGSPRLEALLTEAERDPRKYLREFAERVRRGDIDL